jgi:hypothetical protein
MRGHGAPVAAAKPGRKARQGLLFLKKKKQKDFYFPAAPTIEAMAGIVTLAQE